MIIIYLNFNSLLPLTLNRNNLVMNESECLKLGAKYGLQK